LFGLNWANYRHSQQLDTFAKFSWIHIGIMGFNWEPIGHFEMYFGFGMPIPNQEVVEHAKIFGNLVLELCNILT
jgi:hypothetical protein